jgi:hypothetical protein
MKNLLAIAMLAAMQCQAPAVAEQRLFLVRGYLEHAGNENGGWFQFATATSASACLPTKQRQVRSSS